MNGRTIGLAFGLAALLVLPFFVTNLYYVNVASQILFWAIFALAVNVLIGYAGLVSLGHAGLFGIAGYATALFLAAGSSHLVAILGSLAVTMAASTVFGALALRSTGIGFLMITLALGQILWGVAYRWVDLTNGDNGVGIATRPAPFGIDLTSPTSFYYMTLLMFLLTMASMIIFVRSPFGASVRGTRDQPRRMSALGYHVWLIRFLAFLFSGFWSGVAGILFAYYFGFVSPQGLALQSSAEVLLMVIAGGTGTLLGPIGGAAVVIIMKSVVSAWIERWNLLLGLVFVGIIIFMPGGLVPGIDRIWRSVWRRISTQVHAADSGSREIG